MSAAAAASEAMRRVLVADEVAPECLAVIRGEEGFAVDYAPGLKPAELLERVALADGLIVRSGVKVTREVLARATRLRVIARAGVGVDNIDVDAATEMGVLVTNTPEGNTVAAAEHTLALLFAAARRAASADRSVREGKWERSKFVGTQLSGKVIGILGLGKVGRAVAERAQGLRMEVVGYDPMLPEDVARKLKIELLSPDFVLKRADFVTVHVPLTDQTRGMIGARELSLLRRGAIVVNCARGGVVDEAALAQALRDGRLSGAGVDVFEKEPPAGSPLLDCPNAVLTPHLGASTREAQELVGMLSARQVVAFLKDGIVENAVNAPSLDRQLLKQIAPWRGLAEKMGALHAHLLGIGLERITVCFAGDALAGEPAQRFLAQAVLAGFFRKFLDSPVNTVNASHIARARGVFVETVQSSETEGYLALITVTVRSKERARSIAGTVIGERRPRIVAIDRYAIEAEPQGHMILFANNDTPGIMGMAGTLMGKNGVNIASMAMGRDVAGGTALAILNVDGPVPDAVARELEQSRGIIWVQRASLG